GGARDSRVELEIVAEDFAAVHGAEGLPGGQRDRVGDEAGRAVTQGDVDAAGVPAAGRAELQPGQAHRHRRVVVRRGQVDHVEGGGVGRGQRHEFKHAVVVLNVAAPVVVVGAFGHQGFGHQQRVGRAVGNVRDPGDPGRAAIAVEVSEGGGDGRGGRHVVLDRTPVDDVVAAAALVEGGRVGEVGAVVAGAVIEGHLGPGQAVQAS